MQTRTWWSNNVSLMPREAARAYCTIPPSVVAVFASGFERILNSGLWEISINTYSCFVCFCLLGSNSFQHLFYSRVTSTCFTERIVEVYLRQAHPKKSIFSGILKLSWWNTTNRLARKLCLKGDDGCHRSYDANNWIYIINFGNRSRVIKS